jgi:hypothetical protein
MITIEEMVGMHLLFNDKTRTFTLNKLQLIITLLRYAKAESGTLLLVSEMQRFFLINPCFKLNMVLK